MIKELKKKGRPFKKNNLSTKPTQCKCKECFFCRIKTNPIKSVVFRKNELIKTI